AIRAPPILPSFPTRRSSDLLLREINRLARRIAAAAGQHLYFPAGILDREHDDLNVLLVIHRGRFAGGAHGHDAVHAALDLRLDRSEEHTSELQSRENLVCRL